MKNPTILQLTKWKCSNINEFYYNQFNKIIHCYSNNIIKTLRNQFTATFLISTNSLRYPFLNKQRAQPIHCDLFQLTSSCIHIWFSFVTISLTQVIHWYPRIHWRNHALRLDTINETATAIHNDDDPSNCEFNSLNLYRS